MIPYDDDKKPAIRKEDVARSAALITAGAVAWVAQKAVGVVVRRVLEAAAHPATNAITPAEAQHDTPPNRRLTRVVHRRWRRDAEGRITDQIDYYAIEHDDDTDIIIRERD